MTPIPDRPLSPPEYCLICGCELIKGRCVNCEGSDVEQVAEALREMYAEDKYYKEKYDDNNKKGYH